MCPVKSQVLDRYIPLHGRSLYLYLLKSLPSVGKCIFQTKITIIEIKDGYCMLLSELFCYFLITSIHILQVSIGYYGDASHSGFFLFNPAIAGGAGGGCHPPTGFSSFSWEWKELLFQTKFLAVVSSLEHLSMKKISDRTYRLGPKIR